MKNLILTVSLLALDLILISAGKVFHKESDDLNGPSLISCGPSFSPLKVADNGKFINILPGLGHHKIIISTKSDSAQLYFNQGLNFYFSYHFKESLASFKEAARFDAANAMIYWGQAIASGPYYNDYYYKMRKDVPEIVNSMKQFAPVATSKEKELVHAMQLRYSDDMTNADRKELDNNYADALQKLILQYNNDNDIKALYVDAVMLQHKWDFWDNDGSPRPWTASLIRNCEEILKADPKHPAALHYYIHLTEASKHPDLGLHSADLLKDEVPGAGHMVHMATHMYQRNGLYAKGVEVNEEANAVNNNSDSLSPNLTLGRNAVLHIFAVQSFCAINAGMYEKGMPVYMRARQRVLDLKTGLEKDTYSQFIYMMPGIARVRLGKWEEVLKEKPPDVSWKYAYVLDNYARGLAYINAKNLPAAKQCLVNIERNLNDSLLAVRIMPFNAPVSSCKIAAGVLKGALLYEEDKAGEALASFNQAIREEDKLVYREPQDWIIPVRQYLGAYLLKMKNPAEAEKAYREDLIANPENGWSLLGMYKSLSAQKKKTEAKKFKTRYETAFKSSDVTPVASVF